MAYYKNKKNQGYVPGDRALPCLTAFICECDTSRLAGGKRTVWKEQLLGAAIGRVAQRKTCNKRCLGWGQTNGDQPSAPTRPKCIDTIPASILPL